MNRATFRIWDDDACRRIHEASLTVLARTGIEMKDERARELCAAAGAAVEGSRVRIPTALVDAALASAPRSWTLRPRGGDTTPLELRDGAGYSGSGPDCLYVSDPETGERRRALLADVETRRARRRGAPQHRLRDEHGAAGRRRERGRRRRPVRRHAPRHAQAHRRLEPVRRRDPVHHARDGGGLRRGGELRLPRHELAAAHAGRRRLQQDARLRRSRHPAGAGAVRLGRRARAGVDHGLRDGRQRRGARRPRRPPARQGRRAVPHGRRHRRHEHADRRRRLQRAGRVARQPGAARRDPLVRPAELALRRPLRQQGPGRAVGARARDRDDHGLLLARHPAARRRLPRERPAERARGPRARRRARRLRARDPRRASRRRRGDRARRDRGRRARRQPPRDQDDATQSPALLAAVADRPEHPRALGRRRPHDPARARARAARGDPGSGAGVRARRGDRARARRAVAEPAARPERPQGGARECEERSAPLV